MDCEMPEMDGFEATRRIRDPAAGTCDAGIPIVAVTAAAMAGDRERCLAAGMDDYLSKPVEPEEVGRVLGKWLCGRESKQQADLVPEISAGSTSVFDEAGLLKRLMGNRSVAQKVVQAFLQDAASQLSGLRTELEHGDATAVRRRAHTIKGAAANVSANDLRAAALEAEQGAMAGDLDKVVELVPRLEEQLARLKAALDNAGWT
jgi:CheY-like chemotaxis protein